MLQYVAKLTSQLILALACLSYLVCFVSFFFYVCVFVSQINE